MTQDQSKIIDKIRKLLNTANDNRGNETERETAMRMALKMLHVHNLEMKDVTDADKKEDREVVFYEEFPDPFRKVIAHNIAELYMCKFYHTKVPNKQKLYFHFVGLESNCEVAKEIASFVIRSVYTESQRLQNKEGGGVHGYGTTFRNAASATIAERCVTMRAEAEQEAESENATPGTALVLASLYDQESGYNDKFITDVLQIKLTPKKPKLVSKSARARAQGHEFGSKVNLSSNLIEGKSAGDDTPQAPAGLLE